MRSFSAGSENGMCPEGGRRPRRRNLRYSSGPADLLLPLLLLLWGARRAEAVRPPLRGARRRAATSGLPPPEPAPGLPLEPTRVSSWVHVSGSAVSVNKSPEAAEDAEPVHSVFTYNLFYVCIGLAVLGAVLVCGHYARRWLKRKPVALGQQEPPTTNRQPMADDWRYVGFGDTAHKQNFCDNAVTTSKYTLLTFAPKNLLEQWQRAANAYFLLIACLLLLAERTRLFEVSVRSGPQFLTLGAMMFCSAFIAAVDDARRHRQDRRTNSETVTVLAFREGTTALVEKEKRDVLVGDVVVVGCDEAFPADVVLLSSTNPHGICYVDTANLDGETNLKMKDSSKAHEALCGGDSALSDLESVVELCRGLAGDVQAELPSKLINQFRGSLTMRVGGEAQDSQEALDPDAIALHANQLLLRGTVLRNTYLCLGIVVYTGRETRMIMNSKKALRQKLSNMDRVMNRLMAVVLSVQAILAFLCALMKYLDAAALAKHWYLRDNVGGHVKDVLLPEAVASFLTFFMLYSNMMPISLYATLELCNFGQAYFINCDLKMYDEPSDTPALVRSTGLCHELGQVSYVFSDKTGTLTQNVMELKRISVWGEKYGELDPRKGFHGGKGLEEIMEANGGRLADLDCFLEVLALAHTVQADPSDTGIPKYEAESPDEGAFVQAAAELGWVFRHRSLDTLACDARGELRQYKVLALNAFDSDRKRMSIVIERDGQLWLLCKGADSSMLEVAEKQQVAPCLEEHLAEFASEGLRTLAIGRRRLGWEEFDAWRDEVAQAGDDKGARREAERRIEVRLELLGCTGIEDKLQEGVEGTILNLRKAGVKVWVLTGDKVETARIIGLKCRLLTEYAKTPLDVMLLDCDQEHLEDPHAALQRRLKQLVYRAEANDRDGKDSALMVTGDALMSCVGENALAQCAEELLILTNYCKVVVACRVSPSQKGEMVRLVREHAVPRPVTLAIGDGANDVSMIQEAQVGVGISGKEGRQAVNASDFAIAQFRFLERLLLLHGRWNYLRTCKFILYSFYKNTVMVWTLVVYSFLCGHTGTSLYEDMLRQAFNCVTFFPVVCLGIFEQDVTAETALAHPELYRVGRLGLHLNTRTFLENLLSSVMHALVLVKLAAWSASGMSLLNIGGYYAFGTTVFSCLVAAMNCRVAFLTHIWNQYSVAAVLLGSFGVYCAFLATYTSFVGLNAQMYMVVYHLVQTAAFWLILFCVPAQAMMLDLFLSFCSLEFKPTKADLLMDLEHSGKRGEWEEQVKYALGLAAHHSAKESALKQGWLQDSWATRAPALPGALAPPATATQPVTSRTESGYAFDAPPRQSAFRGRLFMWKKSALTSTDDLRSMASKKPIQQPSRRPTASALAQQTLPSRRLWLTWRFHLSMTLIVGIVFVILGSWALRLSRSAEQLRVQYDGRQGAPDYSHGGLTPLWRKPITLQDVHYHECALESGSGTRICTFQIQIQNDMTPPIEVNYLVTPFYQNANRYLFSVDDRELAGSTVDEHVAASCREAKEDASGYRLHPCGLQARAFFNDSFEIGLGPDAPLDLIDERNIAWKSDLKGRFKNPPNYGEPGIGIRWLHDRFPGVIDANVGVRDEHFIQHMNPGALGYAYKEYGKIRTPLRAGQNLTIRVTSRFPVHAYGGQKHLILTMTTALGGRNDFLGVELLWSGVLCFLFAGFIACKRGCCPHPGLGSGVKARQRRSGIRLSNRDPEFEESLSTARS